MKEAILIGVILLVGLWISLSIESVGEKLHEVYTELWRINYELNHMRRKIVHCKDCKYYSNGRCGWHVGAGYKWVVDDDDFCSCGVRMDERKEE